MQYVIPFEQLSMKDIAIVGGKNASLGEMISQLTHLGVRVPTGFATTAAAYADFLNQNKLDDKINTLLSQCNVNDLSSLNKTGETIRQWMLDATFSPEFDHAIRRAYETLQHNHQNITVAVRSSATAEDLPDASFAGQQETYLNISGIENVLTAIKKVFASLFTDRAISYRVHRNFKHEEVLLSVGIQQMVRSDLAASGVMFTIDTESGFKDAILITSSYGLGEMVVQGAVNPDEFYVHKPTLKAGFKSIVRKTLGSKKEKLIFSKDLNVGKTIEKMPVDLQDQRRYSLNDEQILQLAQSAMVIEAHYKMPMDIEWGLDGDDQQIYILQARPETVTSQKKSLVLEKYLLAKHTQKPLITGRSIGQKIGKGTAKILKSIEQMDQIQPGDIMMNKNTSK